MPAPASVTVVGAGAAGLSTAEYLRAGGFAGPITVIGDEPGVPYDRPPLSKQVMAGAWPESKAALFAPARLDALGVDLIQGHAATALDRSGRRITLESGREVGYDALVIATGLRSRRLPGALGDAAVTLRTMAESVWLRDRIGPGCRVLVIGGGFLGLEAAASARQRGADVTVVEPVSGPPLASRLGTLAATRLLARHRAEGVEARTGVGVTGDSTPDLIRLTDGSSVEADLVLTCVGSTPAVEWLRGSGLDLGDGVLCDEFCAAAPGIWAVGDVANWPHPVLGRRLRLEHRTNATEQARAVAQNILGEPAPFVPVPFFWSDHYDLKIQVAGFVSPSAQAEVSDGDPDASSFVQTYSEHGRLVGVVGWNAARRVPAYRNQLAAAYRSLPAPAPSTAPAPATAILKPVACPACGGIVESTNDDELVRLAKLHTVRIHRYDVPEEHVRLSIESVEVD